MAARRANPRLVKIHRTYKVEEVALLFTVHKNTVRTWLKSGLSAIDSRRPILILGRVLADFLAARRATNRRTCKPIEMYCVKCREPRIPAGRMADYRPLTPTAGNLLAICPTCESMMNRRASLSKLAAFCAEIDVTFPQGQQRISQSPQPSANSDFEQEAQHHVKPQSHQ